MSSDSPPRRRARRVLTAFASLTGSLAIHIALVAGAATVVWQVGMSRPHSPRELIITFDAPGESAAQAPRPQQAARARAADAEPRPSAVMAAEPLKSGPAPAAAPSPIESALGELSGLTTAPPSAAPGDGRAASATGAESLLSVDAASISADAAMPDVTFAGLGAGHVKSVVYVVDCSGPMVTSLPRVTAELRRSIDRLSPTQKFAVVLFSRTEDGSNPVELFAPVLVRATPQAKRLAVEWVERVQPRGASNPLAGLEAAIELKPDAVFLLSRSIERSGGGVWELGRERTLHRLDQLNPADPGTGRRPMLIQTIQFLDEDPTGAMQAIGTIHGRAAADADDAVAGYTVIRRSEDLSRR